MKYVVCGLLHSFFLISGLAGAAEAPPVPDNDYSLKASLEELEQLAMELRTDSQTDDEIADSFLLRIGQLQIQAQLPERATITSGLIRDRSLRNELLASVAHHYSRCGNLDACRRMAAESAPSANEDSEQQTLICRAIIEALLLRMRYREAIAFASMQSSSEGRRASLFKIGSHATTTGHLTTAYSVVSDLGPRDRCLLLCSIAHAVTEVDHERLQSFQLLAEASAVAEKVLPEDSLTTPVTQLCLGYDEIGQPAKADDLMERVSNLPDRAACAMQRAARFARRQDLRHMRQCLEIAHGLDPDASIANVLLECASQGNVALGLEIASAYSPEGRLESDLTVGLFEPCFQKRDLVHAIAIAHLFSDAYHRSDSLLRCTEALVSAESVVADDDAAKGLLSVTALLTKRVDNRDLRLLLTASTAELWHLLGDSRMAQDRLRAAIRSAGTFEELDQVTLRKLIFTSWALGMEAEGEMLMQRLGPKDSLSCRVHRLCRQLRFRDALQLADEKQGDATDLVTEILVSAARHGAHEWAIDQTMSDSLDPRVELERLISIFEEVSSGATAE